MPLASGQKAEVHIAAAKIPTDPDDKRELGQRLIFYHHFEYASPSGRGLSFTK